MKLAVTVDVSGCVGAVCTGGNAQQITDPNSNNRQINIKIDHNFNAKHKAAFNYTYQRDNSDGNVSSWPDGPSGSVVRLPHVFTVNVGIVEMKVPFVGFRRWRSTASANDIREAAIVSDDLADKVEIRTVALVVRTPSGKSHR
jgi:hypothetical protein